MSNQFVINVHCLFNWIQLSNQFQVLGDLKQSILDISFVVTMYRFSVICDYSFPGSFGASAPPYGPSQFMCPISLQPDLASCCIEIGMRKLTGG